MEHESARKAFLYDALDFSGPASEADVAGAPAKHALLFCRAWFAVFGAVPPATMHDEYCAGSLPRAAALHPPRFLEFVAARGARPGQQMPDLGAYAASLEDPGALERETRARILDRYDQQPDGRCAGLPLAKAHALARASADMNELEAGRNPVTSHHTGAPPPPFAPCRREAWRHAVARDTLLTAQATHGKCIFVSSEAAALAGSAGMVACELASSSHMPITILSDCPALLRRVSEGADFYHYAHHVPCVDAYMAMPRVFQAFVLFGGDGRRPPLCRARERCWFYAAGRGGVREEEGAHYSVVADTFEACMESQAAVKRLVYYAPSIAPPPCDKDIAFGFHPDSAGLAVCVKDPAVVAPGEAHRCRVYVSCVSQEGVERCMAGGGVAVARDHRFIDDGVNGFLSGTAGGQDVNKAVLRAVSCDKDATGAEAGRLAAVLKSEETFRWVWRGILSRADPLVTNSPRDAQLLHERCLVVSASLRHRQIMRYRATTAMRRTVVFMDNRPDPGTALAVLLSLANLRAGWSVTGFVTAESRGYFSRALAHLGDDALLVDMPGYRKRSFFIEQYNAAFKSLDTWLPVAERADVALTVQNDGLLVREGLEDHPAMGHDYCGAPWKPHPYLEAATSGNLVGNGGFSLRSPAAMVDVCRRFSDQLASVYPMAPVMSEAEDVFFARRVARPCPARHAATFAMEQCSSPDALGYHRFWAYHPVDFTVRVLERVLQDTTHAVPSTKEPQAVRRRRVTPSRIL